jgi:endonuclease/exonuclease/phosphatase (EEP) superfamily protein YafD
MPLVRRVAPTFVVDQRGGSVRTGEPGTNQAGRPKANKDGEPEPGRDGEPGPGRDGEVAAGSPLSSSPAPSVPAAPASPTPASPAPASDTAAPDGAARRRPAWFAAVAAWALTACWVIWAVLRLTGAERVAGLPWLVVPAVAFFPYAAATAIIPVAGALLLRRRWAAALAAVVAIVMSAVIVPRAVTDTAAAGARGPVLRVLTANLLYGQARPEAVVGLVRRTGADVVSLQELTPAAVDRLESAGLARLLPHRVLRPHEGPWGSGLYARHRLRDLGEVGGADAPGFAMPRAAMELPGASGGTVEVVAVHPWPPTTRWRVRQWGRGMEGLRALPPAASPRRVRILAGDFNATLDHARMRRLLDDGGYRDAAAAAGMGLTPTFGDSWTAPPITIDHVLADRRVGVRAVAVHDVPGSDHESVVAELRLP